MLYGARMCATIAKGSITSIDMSRAEAMPGMKAVYHRQNIGTIWRSPLAAFT
jgi:xanthine dehydrogenase YagR molybdenum-binding subunit